MKFFPRRSAALFFVFGISSFGLLRHSPSQNAQASALCGDGECRPAITSITYFNRPAYKLTDGLTEAIIVPDIGRIMSFSKVGGINVLWNAPTSKGIDTGWKNFGGDKNWLAPQSDWATMQGSKWPPDPALDGQPFHADILSGGKVQLTSPLSASGIRYIRTLYYTDNGELVIEQTARKEKGAPVRAAIWTITQAVPGEAVFLPLNPMSSYEGGHSLIDTPQLDQKFEVVKPNLLRVKPTQGGANCKVGVDSNISAIATVTNGVAFVEKAAHPAGPYPDGKSGAGFPVEFYLSASPKMYYCEMELLGPLKNFTVGSKTTHTVRWSLHDLPSKDVNSAEMADAVEKLLF